MYVIQLLYIEDLLTKKYSGKKGMAEMFTL